MCKIKVSFRKEHKPPKKVNYDYSALKSDVELQKKSMQLKFGTDFLAW